MPFALNITPTERATHASGREPSAFAEVTSEEREALQNKPPHSGFAASSFSTTNATLKKWAFQKLKPSSPIWRLQKGSWIGAIGKTPVGEWELTLPIAEEVSYSGRTPE
jgi:hypothetical protein